MNLVLAVQERNIKNAVESYEKINTKIKITAPKNGIRNFFERIISKIPFCVAFKVPRSDVFVANP